MLTEDEKVRILNRIDDPAPCLVTIWEDPDTGWVEKCGDPEYLLFSNKCLAHWQFEKGLL